jgi:hypothetical protein
LTELTARAIYVENAIEIYTANSIAEPLIKQRLTQRRQGDAKKKSTGKIP